MLWCIPLHGVSICCYDSFNKQADWPIYEQNNSRQERQTENSGKEKGKVGSCQPEAKEAGLVQNEVTIHDTHGNK